MPKLANYKERIAGANVGYTMHEDTNGRWHSCLSINATGDDAIDVANKTAQAMREVAKTPPDHSHKCVCLLCAVVYKLTPSQLANIKTQILTRYKRLNDDKKIRESIDRLSAPETPE